MEPAPPTHRSRIKRRHAVAGAGAIALLPLYAAYQATGTRPVAAAALVEDLEQRSFRFFWETTDAKTGLVPDRWPTPSFASIAAMAFALTSCPIGVARGWITRGQARARVLTTLRFLRELPQGPQPTGTASHKGFFYHFLDMASGTRFAQCELSTMDTALLLAGALHCQSFFDGSDAEETQIRTLAESSTVVSTGHGHRRARRCSLGAGTLKPASSPTTGKATAKPSCST
jgi:hypothetical protein